jgi:hypothetical protein
MQQSDMEPKILTALLSQGWVPVSGLANTESGPVNTESGPIEGRKSCSTYGG